MCMRIQKLSVFTIKTAVPERGYRRDHDDEQKLNAHGFVPPLMLKIVTIFSIPLFKVQRVCEDSPTHQKSSSFIINIDFGGTARQETRSPKCALNLRSSIRMSVETQRVKSIEYHWLGVIE